MWSDLYEHEYSIAARRNDGRDSLAIYTNPAFFADRWIDQMLSIGDNLTADGALKKVRLRLRVNLSICLLLRISQYFFMRCLPQAKSVIISHLIPYLYNYTLVLEVQFLYWTVYLTDQQQQLFNIFATDILHFDS